MADKSDGMEWEYYDDNEVLPDFWQGFVDEDADFKKPLKFWLKYFTNPYENTYGWNIYREYWRVWVPLLLAPRHGTTSVDKLSAAEERRVQEVLLDPLEQFIAGAQQSLPVFAKLSESDAPPAVCGYVFKNGDTCYNCRDCGQDATCVLCAKCFTNSAHKNHRYRMHTSEGGGICDCGDAEAFTKDFLCSTHLEQAKEGKSAVEVLKTFPQDVRRRAADLLYHVCVYAVNIVADFKAQLDLKSGAKEKELFPDLQYPLRHSNYCVVLLNDENHSYEEVIKVLKKVLPGAAEKTVVDLTTFVDKFGKAVIKVGKYQDCLAVSERISSLTRLPHSTVLKSAVVTSLQVAHERFAARLLSWVPRLFKKSSGFRALISQVLLMRSEATNVKIVRHSEETTHPIGEAVLLNELNTWKQMRNLWMELLLDGLMKDYESKRELAVLFTTNYPSLVSDFIQDDQEKDASVMSLSVQIFTVPSISLHLIEEHDAITQMMQGFLGLLTESTDEDDKLELNWLDEEKSEFQRMLASIKDITYLLSVAPGRDEAWSPALETNFLRGLESVLRALSYMQGMDAMTRQVGLHVEHEDQQWRLAYELQSSFNEIVSLVTTWVLANHAVRDKSIQMTLTKISEHTPSFPELTKHLAFLGPPELYNVLDYDMLSRPVSINAPLHRFLINLIAASPKMVQPPPPAVAAAYPGRLLQQIEWHLPLLNLVDPVLQAIVLVGQINVGMWRRNGGRADSLAFLYNNRTYLTGLRESDLLLMQLGASLSTSVNRFLVNILARYKLAKWVTGELDSESATRSDDFVEKCNGLADQFLLLVIALVGERHAAGVGENMTSRLELRRDLIHILCIEPLSHSGILKKLTNLEENEPDIDEILAEVSELKHCTKNPGKKVYYLRSGLEAEFNMFFYGFTKEQQTAAQEYQLNSRLKKGDPCPPPQLPRFTPLFAGVQRVLESSVVLQTCAVTLRRSVDTSTSRSKYFTENQLHKVLYIVCLGLRQDEADSSSTFKEKLAGAGILDLLTRLTRERSDLPEHITRLAAWVQSRLLVKDPGQEEMDTTEAAAGSSEQLRKRRAEAAKARKAKILAQMSQMQRNFANENRGELESIRAEEEAAAEEPRHPEQGESEETETVCLGPGQTEHKEAAASHQCILCQETEVEGSAATLVMTAYVQRSTVLSQVGTCEREEPPVVAELVMGVERDCVPNISSCGHLMHARCYQKYFEIQVMKERDRNLSIMTRNFSNYDVSAAEYTCPICERLCNTIIPVIQPISTLRKKQTAAPLVEVGLNTFLAALKDVADSITVREEAGPVLARLSPGRTRLELGAAHGPEVTACFPETTDSGAPLIDEVYNMLNVFSMSVFTNSLVVNPDEQDYRVALMTIQATAATLVHLEVCLAQDDRPLFGSMTSRDEQLVRCLVRVVSAYGASGLRLQYLQKNALYLLARLFGGKGESVFDADAFGLLVSLVVSLPCLFASSRPPRFMSGQGVELHCLKICLLVHVVQLVQGYPERCFIEFLGTRTNTGADLLHKVMACIAAKRKFSLDVSKMNSTKMLARLEKDVLPFLRCAALLFHELTGVNPGVELVEDGGREYRPLACYLGLPASLSLLLESPAAASLLDLVLLAPSSSSLEDAGDQPPTRHPLLPSSFRRSLPPPSSKQYYPLASLVGADWSGGLIPLPHDYTDLLHRASEFSCPNSVTGESKDPALCLVCGVMVCSSSHCCEATIEGQHVGGCTAHARRCTAGTGIFLKTRDCYIFLLHKLYRGAILPAPYLDEYGETDQRLKRGNPLYLDRDRYNEINRMWSRNEIPEKIARKFDADVVMLINWQMF